ncbi:MAG TPA: hypothetical protein VN040_17630, partial [Pseudosphingobacterium sp.]|nr:hypothetical protein [Pseudosphingobacterium sp.]
ISSKIISEITRFFNDSYVDPKIFRLLREKWRSHVSQKIPGGVCDMTQLKLFFDLNGKNYSIYNAYALTNQSIPDGNINSDLNYTENNQKFKMLNGKKHVFIENYKAYGYLATGEKVQFNSSHFQGAAKYKMHYYTKEHYNPDTFINYLTYKLSVLLAPFLKPIKIMVKSFLNNS